MKVFKKFGVFIALLFGVAALAMLFIAPAGMDGDAGIAVAGGKELNGFELIFGKELGNLGALGNVSTLFNFLGLLALILLVAGIVVSLLPMKGKLKLLISAVLLLAAGVLFFVFPGTVELKGVIMGLSRTEKAGLTPGLSVILAGVFSLVAFLINGALALLTK